MIKPKPLIDKMWRPEPDDTSRIDKYRFNSNERTTLFDDKEFSRIISELSPYDLVAYGELEPFYLKIVNWLNLNRENILLTAGSDAGIKAIYETYVSEGDEVIVTLPNYAMFSAYADMFGANQVKVFYNEELLLDNSKLLNMINPQTRLVIISNPGHTGTIVSRDNLLEIIIKAEKCNSLVLVDEAYYHFYPETIIDVIDDFENLIVSRTFSKAFGLPSIRIGLLIGNKNRINDLYKVKLVHEITGVAAKIGIFFLDNLNIVTKYVSDVNKGKEILYTRLKEIGFIVFESKANFIFFKPPKNIDPINIINFLEKQKILINGPFIKYPFDNHLRITVGDKSQMNFLCDELNNFVNK